MLCLFLKSARRQCALYLRFVLFECSEFMLIVAQLHQGGGPNMLNGRPDTFHALPRISRLVKRSHGAFKPSMAWLRNACYIVNLEDIKEASGFDVTCVVVRISDMERLYLSSGTMPVLGQVS